MSSPNASGKDILIAVAVVVSLLAAGIFTISGYRVLGGLIFLILLVLVIYSFFKMPWQEIGKIESDRRQKLLPTKTGKMRYALTKLIDYSSILIVVFMCLTFIAAIGLKVFGNGS